MTEINSNNGRPQLPYIGVMKLILIMGVVMVHCNLRNIYPSEWSSHLSGVMITSFLSEALWRIAVPGFFILSGLLFFLGIEKFSWQVYTGKLRKRVKTLLIPYLVWSIICCGLLYAKHRLFHMSGLGIFLDDGGVDWCAFIKGFWIIKADNNFPYPFAFWFIRNLMGFVVMSPFVWIICKRIWMTVLFYIIYIFTDLNFMGFEWFLLGGFLSIHFTWFRKIDLDQWRYFLVSVAGVAIGCWGYEYCRDGWVGCLLFCWEVTGGLYLILWSSKRLDGKGIVKFIMPATFMIYATHQCYCTILKTSYARMSGDFMLVSPLIAYFCSFVTMIGVGVTLNYLLKCFCPRSLLLLTGNR